MGKLLGLLRADISSKQKLHKPWRVKSEPLVVCYTVFTGADLGGPSGQPPPPPTPNFEAQIFATAATPLRDVDKISVGPPPPYTDPTGSAPGLISGSLVVISPQANHNCAVIYILLDGCVISDMVIFIMLFDQLGLCLENKLKSTFQLRI